MTDFKLSDDFLLFLSFIISITAVLNEYFLFSFWSRLLNFAPDRRFVGRVLNCRYSTGEVSGLESFGGEVVDRSSSKTMSLKEDVLLLGVIVP